MQVPANKEKLETQDWLVSAALEVLAVLEVEAVKMQRLAAEELMEVLQAASLEVLAETEDQAIQIRTVLPYMVQMAQQVVLATQ